MTLPIKLLLASLFFALHAFPAFAASSQMAAVISGRVVDSNGAPTALAEVVLTSQGAASRSTRTAADGTFSFVGLAAGEYRMVVELQGFKRHSESFSLAAEEMRQVIVRLEVGELSASVTSSARAPEVLTSRQGTVITSISPRQIGEAGAQTIDDLLRQIPGFSNFRRSSSLVANPTTQGVSLRGAGASGASRTIVLADGVPLNDAFGGWVYWDRIPREAIAGIEVERGGASHLYGSDALSGVINLTTRQVRAATVSASASYGTLGTADGSFFAGDKLGKLNVAVYGEAFRTDGYYILAPAIRGAADARANSQHRTISLRTGVDLLSDLLFFGRAYLYDQERNNGTQLQLNDTSNQGFATGAKFNTPDQSYWTLSIFGSKQLYHQDFTSVVTSRATEALIRQQAAPSRDLGFRLNWTRSTGHSHTLFGGVELRGVRGTSDEVVWSSGKATSIVSAGGRQRRFGIFGQDYLSIGKRWALALSARYDEWRDSSAASVTRSLSTGVVTPNFFQPRSESAFSPRAAIIFRPVSGLEMRASGYRAFRAPTLNELYRSFRVGDTLTTANENLLAERLSGGEAGVNWAAWRRLTTRLTTYFTEIVNPVSNYTVSVTPTLITRQRRNLGRTRSRGLEAEIDWAITDRLRLSAGYLFADAIFKRAPQDVRLEGLAIPQVPRHQLTFQTSYSNPRILSTALQLRIAGRQFDDDQNLLPLKAYSVVDWTASRSLGRYLEAFVAVQNLFNETVIVGRTPLETIGMPRMIRGGVKLRFER